MRDKVNIPEKLDELLRPLGAADRRALQRQ